MNNRERYWQRGEFYLVVLFFAFFMMIFVGAFDFPRLVKMFPLLVGSVGLFLIIMDILQMLIPKFGVQFRSLKGGEVFETGITDAKRMVIEGHNEDEESVKGMSILKTFFWFVGAFVTFFLLGYLLFSTLFLFLFLKFYAAFNLRKSVAITGGFALCLWMAFSLFLKLDIFAGSALF